MIIYRNFVKLNADTLEKHLVFLYDFDMFLSCFHSVRPAAAVAAVERPVNMAELLMHIVVFFIAQLSRSSARTLCKSNVFYVRRRHARQFSIT